MKRALITYLIITAMLSSPLLHGDDLSGSPKMESTSSTEEETSVTPLSTTEEGTPVEKESSDKGRAAKRKFWENMIIATAAVAVAVTALILVSSNQGNKH